MTRQGCPPPGSCFTSKDCRTAGWGPTGRCAAPMIYLPVSMAGGEGRGRHPDSQLLPTLKHWSRRVVQQNVPEGRAHRSALFATFPHRHFLPGHPMPTRCQGAARDDSHRGPRRLRARPCMKAPRYVWVAYGPEGAQEVDLHIPCLPTPLGGLIGDKLRRQAVRIGGTSLSEVFGA